MTWWIPLLAVLAVLPWSVRRRRWEPPTRAAPLGASRAQRIDSALVVDIAAAVIGSGASIPDALAALGTALPGEQGVALLRVVRTLRLGGSWETAWRGAPKELEALASALGPSWTDGIAPGALLAHASSGVRLRRADAAREAAARLGVRLVLPMGLCWLPAFVLLGLVPVLLGTGASLWFLGANGL